MRKIFSKIFKRRERTVQQQINRRTIISFSIFLISLAIGIFAFKWLYDQPANADDARAPLRKGLEKNEQFFGSIFSKTKIAKTYPRSAAVKDVRVNGDVGMGNDFDTATWKLRVVRKEGDTLLLTMNDLKALPKTEVTFDFKCIEGWSQVTNWGGVKFTDFIKKYNLTTQSSMKYVGMETPDKEYYVGIDVPSMLQPQTILCYEMNGKPLPMSQGYPLRLIIPVKYGIKNIKRIGTLFFSDNKPRDYWAEHGYDYYAGL